MNKKSFIFCVAFCSYLLCVAAIAFVQSNLRNNITYTSSYIEKTTDKQVSKIVEGHGYWLRANNNHIVIYDENNKFVTDTEIEMDTLSDQDKSIINRGIFVDSASTLYRYLESYTS